MELEAFNNGRAEQINPDLPIDEQAELLPYAHDEWEFPKDRLILGQYGGRELLFLLLLVKRRHWSCLSVRAIPSAIARR